MSTDPRIQEHIQDSVNALLDGSASGDLMFFAGVQQESIPTALFLDPTLRPVDRNLWVVMRLCMRSGGKRTAFPSYEDLENVWRVGSRDTLSISYALLRLRGWLTRVHAVRDAQGRHRGQIWMMHDEPAPLAGALPSVPIVADARRRDAAARAETLGTPVDLHLLDDGFSHVALARDVDVVLLDATAPDAGGALLPAGRLREPLSSLARADLLVVTKTEQSDPGPALEIARRFAPGVPVYRARTEVLGVTGRDGLPVEPGDLPPGTAVAVAGIARPEAFGATLASIGIEPVELLSFRDHEPYGPASLGRIERALEESGATAVVTTEKDAVKLDERLRVPVFRVAVEARPVEPTFVADLLSLLARRPS